MWTGIAQNDMFVLHFQLSIIKRRRDMKEKLGGGKERERKNEKCQHMVFKEMI
jgi:hypothetical protein